MFLHAEAFHGNLLEKQILPISATPAGSRETQTRTKVEAILQTGCQAE